MSCHARCDCSSKSHKKSCKYKYSNAQKAKFTFPGDKCPERPDFIIAGAGTTSLPLADKLSEQGHRVLVLEIGKDWENDCVVTKPLLQSRFLGNTDSCIPPPPPPEEGGPLIANTLATIYDPRITTYAGNADGPGQGFRMFPFATGRGVGGGGLHWLVTSAWPGDWILDGIDQEFNLYPGVVPVESRNPIGHNSTTSFRQAGGEEWTADIINTIIKEEIESYKIGQNTVSVPGAVIPGFVDNDVSPATSECFAKRGTNGPQFILANLPVNTESLPPTAPQFVLQKSLEQAATLVGGGAPAPIVQDYNCIENCVSQSQNFFSPDPEAPRPAPPFFDPTVVERQNSASAWVYNKTVLDAEGNRRGINGRKLLIMTDRPVVRAFEDTKRTQKNGLWTAGGVEFLFRNQLYYVKGKNVISGMGPTYSPQFWLRSGIGPADELTEVGVDVKVDSPLVGKNLQNQYGAGTMFSAKTTDPARWARLGISFIQQNGVPRRLQNLNVAFGEQATQSGLIQPVVKPIDSEREYFNFVGFNLVPRSRGYIKLTSPDFGVQAQYHWNFYSDGPDPNLVASGIDAIDKDSDIWAACEQQDYHYQTLLNMRALAPAEEFRMEFPPESIWLENPGNSDAEKQARYRKLVPYIQIGGLAAFHEAGTVVMNNDPAKGACDGNLKMHGTANCFTVDGAIMPVQALGNTGLLEQAIGRNAGRLIPKVAQLYPCH